MEKFTLKEFLKVFERLDPEVEIKCLVLGITFNEPLFDEGNDSNIQLHGSLYDIHTTLKNISIHMLED